MAGNGAMARGGAHTGGRNHIGLANGSGLDLLLEKLLARPRKITRYRTLAASAPGARHIERTAAERYEVQSGYKRPDQRLNMTRQGHWNQEAMILRRNQGENRRKLVQARKPGYSILDWAFAEAAEASQRMIGFGINMPNRGPTSWKPLRAHAPEGMENWSGDPATNSWIIKKIGRIFGAGDVGITVLDRRWVYETWFNEETKQSYPVRFSDEPGLENTAEPVELDDHTLVIPSRMKYVAVFILPMLRQGVRAAPTLTHLASTMVTYSEIGTLVLSVAEFIRGLGYNAIPSSNCTALNIPLAIDAGLGELGRNAKLIHPVWGPVCRICKVLTDLPLESDIPIETGATAFCESCRKCADSCPSRAIPKGPRSFDPIGDYSSAGVRQWQLNHWKCYEFWSRAGTNCGLCLVSCPFNKGAHWSHHAVKTAIANVPALDPLIVAMDDAFGYGKTYLDAFWDTKAPDAYR